MNHIKPNSVIDFMIANTIYPMCSRNGKVFLRCSRKGLLTEERTKEIIQKLNLKTADECQKLRQERRLFGKCIVLQRGAKEVKNRKKGALKAQNKKIKSTNEPRGENDKSRNK